MSIETGLRTQLVNNTAVAAIVGSRVYPVKMPLGYTLPCISYQRISSERYPFLDGPSGRVIPRFQVDCYAESYSDVRELAEKVRLALDGFKGALGSEAHVGGISIQSERDLWEDNTEVFRVTQDYLVPHIETTT